MYSLFNELDCLKLYGVIGIKVFQVSNERPKPGPKTGEKTSNGLELQPLFSEGLLDKVSSREKKTFALAVEVERRDDLHVVWTEGPSKIIRMPRDQTPDSPTATFIKRIPTTTTLSGEFVTKKNDCQGNGVWVLSTANGVLKMWEVAIVTILEAGQSKYYLSVQKVYEAVLYEEPNGLIFVPSEQFPGYEDWASLREFIESVASRCTLHSYRGKEVVEEMASLLDGEAQVVWFNQASGYGFARVNGEEINPNFHRSQVVDQEFPAFYSGRIIRYEKLNRLPNGKTQLLGVFNK